MISRYLVGFLGGLLVALAFTGLGCGDDLSQAVAGHSEEDKFASDQCFAEIRGGLDRLGERDAGEIAWVLVLPVDVVGRVRVAAPQRDIVFSCAEHCEAGSEAAAPNHRNGKAHARQSNGFAGARRVKSPRTAVTT